ncbi:DUF3953 domain-containing protein [Domibacillus robiginosus]
MLNFLAIMFVSMGISEIEEKRRPSAFFMFLVLSPGIIACIFSRKMR